MKDLLILNKVFRFRNGARKTGWFRTKPSNLEMGHERLVTCEQSVHLETAHERLVNKTFKFRKGIRKTEQSFKFKNNAWEKRLIPNKALKFRNGAQKTLIPNKAFKFRKTGHLRIKRSIRNSARKTGWTKRSNLEMAHERLVDSEPSFQI